MTNGKIYIKRVNIYRKELPVWLKAIFQAIFFSFTICLFAVIIFSYVYIYVEEVEGSSMYPTIYNGDAVYVSRIGTPDYSNIIVTKRSTGKYVIKRLIAKGGDKICVAERPAIPGQISSIYDILLIKKGTTLPIILDETSYLSENIDMSSKYSDYEKLKRNSDIVNKFSFLDVTLTMYSYFNVTLRFLEIPDDYVFYIGDNRINSYDCLNYGPEKSSTVIGRVDIIVPGAKSHFYHIVTSLFQLIF